MEIESLEKQATQLRLDVIKMIGPNKKGHFGGSMSVMDVMTALYFHIMKIDSDNPKWKQRDRLILSKGHSCPAQYVALARKSFFPIEELASLKNIGSNLQGHPDRIKTKGIEVNTGSLGQGLSQGNGMALSMKMDDVKSHVFVIVGDGELNEGQVWEAAMFTAAKCLDNVTIIIDKNNLQAMGPTCDRLDSGNLSDKFKAFGWRILEIDGHDMGEIIQALNEARNDGTPTCVVAKTIKGKGIKIAENNPAFHNGLLNDKQYLQAIADLEGML
jgi:transketolase